LPLPTPPPPHFSVLPTTINDHNDIDNDTNHTTAHATANNDINATYNNATATTTAPTKQPTDITSGNKKLNLGFVAQIFNTCPGLTMPEDFDFAGLEVRGCCCCSCGRCGLIVL
jgi:hypothetical protein